MFQLKMHCCFLGSIFIPFFHTSLLQLREILISHKTILYNFFCLISEKKYPRKKKKKSFLDLHETYLYFIYKSKLLTTEEFKLWYIFVIKNELYPKKFYR